MVMAKEFGVHVVKYGDHEAPKDLITLNAACKLVNKAYQALMYAAATGRLPLYRYQGLPTRLVSIADVRYCATHSLGWTFDDDLAKTLQAK